MRFFVLGLLLILTISNVSCAIDTMNEKPKRVTRIAYPYVASPERQEAILSGYGRITTEMSATDVKKIIGSPDEVNYTFDINNRSKKIGYSFVYLLSRKQEVGSINDKQEHLVRVMFNLNDEVLRIDKW